MTERQEDSGKEPDGVAPGRPMRLLVAMPALNEEKTVGSVIARVPRDIRGIGELEVLVVDDASTDATSRVAAEAGATVIRQYRTGGVGRAFHTALRYARRKAFDLLVTIDSDGQFDPQYIPKLVRPVLAGEADFATASRFVDPGLVPQMSKLKLWGNRLMSRLISSIAGQKFWDVSCGMRCYGREAMNRLNLVGAFTYTQEVFLNLSFYDQRIVEVPVPIRGRREHGKSRVASNLLAYGFKTMRILFRWYRDYRPMRFFGRITLCLMLAGASLEAFMFAHYLSTGMFSPHIWAGFAGAALFGIGLQTLLFGMIGDMLGRQRMYLEELLYEARRGSGPTQPSFAKPAGAAEKAHGSAPVDRTR